MPENLPADTKLDGTLFGENQPCFGCGPSHPFGFRLRFEREDEAVVTRFTPLETHQGPPGIMHGGLVLTLADEIAAWAIIAVLGKFGFTVQVEAKLRAPVRVGVEVVGRATLLRESSRLVRVGVKLVQSEAQVFSAELGFALMDADGAERLLGGPLPEAWRRFAR